MPTLPAHEFAKHLEGGPPAPVYLFLGEAALLMEEAWNGLIAELMPQRTRGFGPERLSAREHTAAQVTARLSTLPLFGKRRLIMVQNVEEWLKDDRTLIESYLHRPVPSACLVLTATKKKGLEKIEPLVAAAGMIVHFSPPSERDAPRWIQERALRTHGKPVSSHAAGLLVELVGVDLHRLDMELEKLAAYAGDRTEIGEKDIREVVSAHRSFSVFELLRLVSQNRTHKAIFILRQLITAGEVPLVILALLARQVRQLWQVKDGLAQRLSPTQIAQRLSLSPSVVRTIVQQAQTFSEEELHRALKALRETDLALKSTGTHPEMAMEALVLNLSLTQKKNP